MHRLCGGPVHLVGRRVCLLGHVPHLGHTDTKSWSGEVVGFGGQGTSSGFKFPPLPRAGDNPSGSSINRPLSLLAHSRLRSRCCLGCCAPSRLLIVVGSLPSLAGGWGAGAALLHWAQSGAASRRQVSAPMRDICSHFCSPFKIC